jgi:hypothetical protein
MNYSTPNLTQHPPRSPRAQLGGYVILPRMLDKCRATIAGHNGEYHFACPLDQRFLQFAGIDPEKLKAEAAKGASDTEILAWIQANVAHKRGDWEIAQWSAAQHQWVPAGNETREFFNGIATGAKAGHREDIRGFFDVLDVDDYVTFGGKP